MKSRIFLLAILAITLAGTGVAFGVTATGTVNLTAEVTSIAELTLGAGTIDFPATNPSTASIPGSATTSVAANVRTGSSSTATLVAVAGTDLTSGSDTIPISNVTSTYSATTGSGFFISGAIPMAKNPGATLATASSNASGSWTGTFTWALANSWTYANGSYAATITYTLTAP
jgi:hypothetical protein